MKKLKALIVAILCIAAFAMFGCAKQATKVTLTLNARTLTLETGESRQLVATCSDKSASLVWTSSDSAVAEVDNVGNVLAKSEGVATVTVAAGNVKATCSVTVNKAKDTRPVLLSVTINGEEAQSVKLFVGLTATIEAKLERGGAAVDATFTYTSSDNAVATVSSGVITAVKKGTANIAYSANFEGNDYSGTIPVTVNDDVLVEIAPTSADICATVGDNDYENTVTLTPTVTVNGEAQNIALVWTSEDDSVATVENGVVTGHKKGQVKITAKATVNGSEYTGYTVVTVHAKKIDLTENALVNRYDAVDGYAALDITVDGEILEITLTGTNATYKTDDGLSINVTDVKSGYYNLSVYTDVCEYKGQLVLADFVIKTAAQLDNWPSYIRPEGWGLDKASSYNKFVVLGADIDYGGANYMNELGVYGSFTVNGRYPKVIEAGKKVADGKADNANAVKAGYDARFYGIFDGLGHTISNIGFDQQRSGLFGEYMHGTVKNLSVVGVDIRRTNFVGAISGRFYGVAENVFVEGKISKNVNAYSGLFSGNLEGSAKLTNVVCILTAGRDALEANDTIAIIGNGDNLVAENYVNVVGIGYGQDAVRTLTSKETFIAGYASVNDYLKDNDTSFATGYWTKAHGMPVFSSAIGKFKADEFYAKADGVEATEISVGSTFEIAARDIAMALATRSNATGYYKFTAEIEGVGELEKSGDNAFILPATVTAGAEILVTATSLLDGSHVTINLTAAERVVDLSDGGKNIQAYFSYADASQPFALTGVEGEVTAVKYNGAEITFTAGENALTIATSALTFAAADYAAGKTVTLDVVTEGYTYKCAVMLCSFAIRTADDLKIWPSKIRPANWNPAGSNSYNGYVVLANDIAYNAKYEYNELVNGSKITDANAYLGSSLAGTISGLTTAYDARFYGTFDGRGHTITNIIIGAQHGGLFGSYFQGNIKNLAIKALSVNNNWTAAFAYRNYSAGVLENIYVEGRCYSTLTREYGMLFGLNYDARTKFKNVVVVQTNTDGNSLVTPNGFGVMGKFAITNDKLTSSNYTNCITIGALSFITDSTGADYIAGYADAAAFKAAGVDTSAFDKSLWDLSGDYPVFKTAK